MFESADTLIMILSCSV